MPNYQITFDTHEFIDTGRIVLHKSVQGEREMARLIDALREEVASLERELERSPTYLKLRETRRLLSFYEEMGRQQAEDNAAWDDDDPKPVRPYSVMGRLPPVNLTILDAARAYLKGQKQPVRTSFLLYELKNRGVTIGGSNPQNTLSSALSKSEEFLSHGRAGWTLNYPRSSDEMFADDEFDNEASANEPNSGPVKPGREVAHENIDDDLLGD